MHRFITSLLFATLSSFAFSQSSTEATLTQTISSAAVTLTLPTVTQTTATATPEFKYSKKISILMDTTAANGQRYPDTVLRVVEKSQRAGDVALLVVGALLGSFRTPVAKEDYKGTKIDSVTHPYKTALAPALERVVDAWLTEKQDTRPLKNPFWIRPNTFSLVFENFSDEEPMFEFWLNTSVSRKPDSAGWLSAPVAVNCNTTGLKRKLVEWQADDFAAVKKLADEHVKDCAKKTADQLTALLKD